MTLTQAVTTVFACLLLLAPLVSNILGVQPNMRVYVPSKAMGAEKRKLADWPQPPGSLPELAALPQALGAAMDDRFGLRFRLIHLGSRMLYAVGVSVTPQVLIGQDGWLFYASSTDGSAVDSYRGTNLYSDEQLDAWFTRVEGQRRVLADRGIAYILVVVPDKHSIYAEKMPAWLNRVVPRTRLDQLAERAAESPQLAFVDLRPALTAAKSIHQVFHQRDTHWNAFGAFAGYREIMLYVCAFHPDAPVLASSRVGFELYATEGDLARMLHLADLLPEEAYRARTSGDRPDRSDALRVTVVGDSFSEALSLLHGSWCEVVRG
ncbi:MAG: hypothetical protein O2782_03935 [bacterium]|nr:hypothetical protein [bacterium]